MSYVWYYVTYVCIVYIGRNRTYLELFWRYLISHDPIHRDIFYSLTTNPNSVNGKHPHLSIEFDKHLNSLEEDYVNDCNKTWIQSAKEVLRNNKIMCLQLLFVRSLKKEGGKYRNVMIVGLANCSKTFILNPLSESCNNQLCMGSLRKRRG